MPPKALSRAHAAGIIHRDIKPDNIFLAQSSDDEGYLVKILDFGVAKMGSAEATRQGSQGATRTGAVLGTPLYMSPEQARGLKTIDHRTDLYSLGLVAYTMFTGNLAFSSESFGDLLLQICTAPLPQLCAGAPWLPPTMEAWFARACAREPQDRYASAQEFAGRAPHRRGRGDTVAGARRRGQPHLEQHRRQPARVRIERNVPRDQPNGRDLYGSRYGQVGRSAWPSAIVSLLVGGAIVTAVVAFGRGSAAIRCTRRASVTSGATAEPPVAAAVGRAAETARAPEAANNCPR